MEGIVSQLVTGTHMTEFGKTEREMGKVATRMQMVTNMTVNGKVT
jgi:hypothetical protein